MWLRTLFDSMNLRRAGTPVRRKQRQQTAARLQLEALDERVVPAFLDAVNYAAGYCPQAVVTGDFNKDAVLDVAVANYSDGTFGNPGDGTVSVLLGNGDGTFQTPISSPAGNSADSLAVGDFNADGKLDLAAAGFRYGNSVVTVLYGDGNGAFPLSDTIFQSSFSLTYSTGVESLVAADFDNDGQLDLAAVTGTSWISDDGYSSGSYTDVTVLGWTSSLDDGIPYASASADFDGDGNLDIATVNSSPDGYFLNVALGSGTGQFFPTYSDTRVGYATELTATDLNNDGKVDLVATAYNGGSVDVLLGTGTGSFGSPRSYPAGPNPHALAVADFNGDGTIDVITANTYPAAVNVLLGTGTGAFTPPVPAAVGSYPVDVAVGDFNGDGMMDAATANAGVSVLINDGVWDGSPPPPPPVPSITINDLNRSEGNTGQTPFAFTVTLSSAYDLPVTVDWATIDGTAAAGSDYLAASGALTFAPGQMSKTITILVNGDQVPEPNKTFLVSLTNLNYGVIADGQGVGTILDDEPRISISDVTKREGRKNTTLFTFTVTLSAAYDQPVTMSFRTVDGTATTSDSDYVAKTGTLTFAPGETTKTITIEVKGDSKKEADETFYLDLFGNSSNSLFTKNRGLGTILNDD